jgi:hypothetical protein
MNNQIVINNITLINFRSIYKSLEISLINDLEKFNFIKEGKFNLKSQDVKKFIFHHIIYGLCEECIKFNKGNKAILIYENTCKESDEIGQYCNIEDFNDLLCKILTKIKGKLPINIYFIDSSVKFSYFKSKPNDGHVKEEVRLIDQSISNLKNIEISFKKIKSLTKTYGLTFLSSDYFSKLRTKQLFIS